MSLIAWTLMRARPEVSDGLYLYSSVVVGVKISMSSSWVE